MPEITFQKPDSLGLEIQRFARANASTLLATAVEWGLVAVLVRSGGNYLVVAGVGAFLGAVMAFALKRQWAFMRRGAGSLRTMRNTARTVSTIEAGKLAEKI